MMFGSQLEAGTGRVRTTVLFAAVILVAGLAMAGGAPLFQAWAAGKTDTVEMSGDSVDYDVKAKISKVTGSSGSPAMLTTDDMILTGNRIEYNETTSIVHAEGNVRMERTAPDPVVMTAAEITANINDDTAVAKGGVVVVNGKSELTAAQASYTGKERQILLTGDVMAKSEGNTLSGKEMAYSLATQKLTVRGGSKVVVIKQPGK